MQSSADADVEKQDQQDQHHSPSPPPTTKRLPYNHRSPNITQSPRQKKGRLVQLNNNDQDQPRSSTSPNRSDVGGGELSVTTSPNNNNLNSSSPSHGQSILDAMSLSAWPSGRAGATPDFVLVLNHFLDDQIKKIDGDAFLPPLLTNNNNNNTNQMDYNTEKSLQIAAGNRSNYRAVARCEVLKKCCSAFEQHFTTYRDIFAKMGASIDVLADAFDHHYRIVQQVEGWKQQVVKREETLRNQMKDIVERHEREYATEGELKKKIADLESQLNKTKNDLDDTYRAYVRAEESLQDVQSRNDELSRTHVMMTLRETRQKDDLLNLERQVDVSHQHAEAKAREVGELRQDIALINGKLYRAEAKIREVENQLTTTTQTLQRKSDELVEKDMEVARLQQQLHQAGIRRHDNNNMNSANASGGGYYNNSNASSTGNFSDNTEINDRIRDAVADREKQLNRVSTPRPDWESLFDKHETRTLLSDLVKPSDQHIISRPSNNINNKEETSPNARSSKISSNNLTVSSKKWSEMLTLALQNAINKNKTLSEEVEKRKEQADSAELQLALSQQLGGGAAGVAGGLGSPKRAAISTRSLGALLGGAGSSPSASPSSSPKNVRAGGIAAGGKKAAQKNPLKNAVFVYSPLSQPEYLKSTNPVPGRLWQLSDVHKVLSHATDFIIAYLSNHNNNNNSNTQVSGSATSPSSTQQQMLLSSITTQSGIFPHLNESITGSPHHHHFNGSTGLINLEGSLNANFNSSLRSPSPGPGHASMSMTGRSPGAAVSRHHNQSSSSSPARGGGGGLQPASSLSETQLIQNFLDQTSKQALQFADAFHNYLVANFGDASVRREIAYNLIYHCRETYPNDVFCRAFLLSLGGDVPADTLQRIRTFVMSFRRSFEVCDAKCCGYVSKKVITTLVKNLMSVYSATEQKIVLSLLDELPQMASRSETLVDYRVLFAGGSNYNNSNIGMGSSARRQSTPNVAAAAGGGASGAGVGLWESPSRFMSIVAAIFFRAMLVDMDAAINAVKSGSSIGHQSNSRHPSRPSSSLGGPLNEHDDEHHQQLQGDISVGSVLTALQSCDPKRDYDIHKDYVTRCIGQCSIKAARIPLDQLVPRMRRNYLPRASVFPADPRFQFPNPSLVAIQREKVDSTQGGTGTTQQKEGGKEKDE